MQPLNMPTRTCQETTVSDLCYAENILFCHPQILQSPAIVLRIQQVVQEAVCRGQCKFRLILSFLNKIIPILLSLRPQIDQASQLPLTKIIAKHQSIYFGRMVCHAYAPDWLGDLPPLEGHAFLTRLRLLALIAI
jgi:hypothetical protein